MDFDLAIIMVWLFLGLSLGWLGLLLALSAANTLQKIQPSHARKNRSFQFNFKGWSDQYSFQFPKHIPNHFLGRIFPSDVSIPDAVNSLAISPNYPPRACELEIRSLSVSPNCCLLRTKQGLPLRGGAVSTRLTRLRRMGVLL